MNSQILNINTSILQKYAHALSNYLSNAIRYKLVKIDSYVLLLDISRDVDYCVTNVVIIEIIFDEPTFSYLTTNEITVDNIVLKINTDIFKIDCFQNLIEQF